MSEASPQDTPHLKSLQLEEERKQNAFEEESSFEDSLMEAIEAELEKSVGDDGNPKPLEASELKEEILEDDVEGEKEDKNLKFKQEPLEEEGEEEEEPQAEEILEEEGSPEETKPELKEASDEVDSPVEDRLSRISSDEDREFFAEVIKRDLESQGDAAKDKIDDLESKNNRLVKQITVLRAKNNAENFEKTTECINQFGKPQKEIVEQANDVLLSAKFGALEAKKLMKSASFEIWRKGKDLESYQENTLYQAYQRYQKLEKAKNVAKERVRSGDINASMPLIVPKDDVVQALDSSVAEIEKDFPILREMRIEGESHPEYDTFYLPMLETVGRALVNKANVINDPIHYAKKQLALEGKLVFENMLLSKENEGLKKENQENQPLVKKYKRLVSSLDNTKTKTAPPSKKEVKTARDAAQNLKASESLSWEEFMDLDFDAKNL